MDSSRDDAALGELGYKPELKRTLGNFHTFADGGPCFCELAARYPVAGSVYNWAKKMGGPHVGWLGGWMMMTATMVTLSAVALAYQITLPQIDGWFQFVGDGSGTGLGYLGAFLFIGVVALGGFAYYWFVQRHRTGVLAEHRPQPADTTVPPSSP
ncbi:hypothetical protein AAGT00_29780 [Streptomyces cavourensis]